MEKRRQIAFAGVSVAMVLLTAACGASKDNSSGQSSNVQPAGGAQNVGAGSTPGTAGASSGAAGGYEAGSDTGAAAGSGSTGNSGSAKKVTAKKDAKLGEIVTDAKGWTLYRFDEDTPKPAKSNCNDACATKWPPVPADAAAGTGIEKSALGSVTRSDGTKQLTLEGWPVYRYAGDTKAGDTKGHGVGGTWNALAPDGKPAGKKAAGTDESLQLMVNNNAELGKIIVDGKGMTVYRFNKDSAWPMKTGCLGACLDTWKPVKAVNTSKVAGLDATKVTSFTRPDGSKQAAFDCWLLYTFTGDTKPGDINGQGKAGQWFAVTDKGKKASAAAQ
ncbi:SCO0930 family lipoprotein [Streptomyces cucumeris]|uniref:SCO0930 family lipoprotein n=1 Tax=Streptomyces cucumeris TaxID=2962890 RepID=UPI003D7505E4